MTNNSHYIRYYFFLFAVIGLVTPYLSWWLNFVLEPKDIKYALASYYLTLIIIPSIWGHMAFSKQKPGQWLSHGTLLAVLFAIGLTQINPNTNLGAICFLLIAFGIFYNPLLPLLEAMAYSQAEDEKQYSKIRLFGSLGFMICSSLVGGVLLMKHPQLFPTLVALLMFATWLFSLPHKNVMHIPPPTSIPILSSIGNDNWAVTKSLRSLSKLWIVIFLSTMGFICYYSFFAMHMKSIGIEGYVVGLMIGGAACAEIIAFWKISWFFKNRDPWFLVFIACLISVIRWIIASIATIDLVWLVALSQLTHAIGFSVFHTACLKIMNRSLPLVHMGAAVGFYNAIGYGVGGVIGVFIAGMLWEGLGGSAVFWFTAIITSIATLVAFEAWIRNKKNRKLNG